MISGQKTTSPNSNRKRFFRKGLKEGFYTVEAAIIISLAAALIAVLILGAVMLNDRAVLLVNALYEAREAVYLLEEPADETGRMDVSRLIDVNLPGTSGEEQQKAAEDAGLRFQSRVRERMLAGELKNASCNFESGKIRLSYEGEFRIHDFSLPGVSGFSGSGTGPEVRRKVIFSPSEMVRLAKGVVSK